MRPPKTAYRCYRQDKKKNSSYQHRNCCAVTDPIKKEPVAQYVISECYVPAVLHLIHDSVIAGHPGRERTLTAARDSYFWPTMRTNVEAHVSKCNECAQIDGALSDPNSGIPTTEPALGLCFH